MIYAWILCTKTRLIRWQEIIVTYIFIHCIVNNSLIIFYCKLEEGKQAALLQCLWIGSIFALFQSFGNILSLKQFLKMVANGLYIESPHSFNIRILILTCPWALLGSSFLIILLTWQLAIIDKGRALSCKIRIKKLIFCLNFRYKFLIMVYWWYTRYFLPFNNVLKRDQYLLGLKLLSGNLRVTKSYDWFYDHECLCKFDFCILSSFWFFYQTTEAPCHQRSSTSLV